MFGFFKKTHIASPVSPINGKVKPVVLLSLDGWGIAPESEGNAISLAQTPNMDSYQTTYPHGELIASGESVGLPANEDGNSEVGHLMMGAGRVMYQSLKRISVSIEDGTFFENPALLSAVENVQKNNSKFHIMGLLSSGNVHSSKEHLYALLDFCKRRAVSNVYLHIFTDGRDSAPNDAINVVAELESRIKDLGLGVIASVAGRYYAMDRDQRWERTQKTYEALVGGVGKTAITIEDAIKQSYADGKTDEFIEPTVIVDQQGKPVGLINDNDTCVFFNFRVDRPRQTTMAFTIPDFENLEAFELGQDIEHGKQDVEVSIGKTFTRSKFLKNLFFVTMTEYQKKLPVSAIAFPPQTAVNNLSEVLSQKGLLQMHLSESEKEKMVTFYFDGLSEKPFPGEDVMIVPSLKVSTYDKKPQMALWDIVSEFESAIAKDKYHFFMVNFANPDMVAHTGNIKATMRACEEVDQAIGVLATQILARDGTLIITADHGNAEELLTYPYTSFFYTSQKGTINTEHSNNPVPFIVIQKSLQGQNRVFRRGSLSDIAPTILGIFKIPVPPEMTGRDLLATGD